jgi:hypothetical protein
VWTVVAEPVVVVTNDSVRFLSVTNTTGVPRKFYRLRAP